jgi:hypothetical protein
MDPNWAADHLQVIRTLMERSAVYRRAMAPLMTFTGIVGLAAGAAGAMIDVADARIFVVFWSLVALIALGGSLVLVRRQALKDQEPFWSPPTRRVAQAMVPPLLAGACLGGFSLGAERAVFPAGYLPILWMCLYGCALCGAGFFMVRGIKLLGWLFLLLGLGLGGVSFFQPGLLNLSAGNFLMMGAFGGLHLAYGIYLFFTEQRGNEL